MSVFLARSEARDVADRKDGQAGGLIELLNGCFERFRPLPISVLGDEDQIFALASFPDQRVRSIWSETDSREMKVIQVQVVPERLPRFGLKQRDEPVDISLNVDIGQEALHWASPFASCRSFFMIASVSARASAT